MYSRVSNFDNILENVISNNNFLACNACNQYIDKIRRYFTVTSCWETDHSSYVLTCLASISLCLRINNGARGCTGGFFCVTIEFLTHIRGIL